MRLNNCITIDVNQLINFLSQLDFSQLDLLCSSSDRAFHHNTEAEPFDPRLVAGCSHTNPDLLETTLKDSFSFLVLLSLANTVG